MSFAQLGAGTVGGIGDLFGTVAGKILTESVGEDSAS
jgi:hypothetical protein